MYRLLFFFCVLSIATLPATAASANTLTENEAIDRLVGESAREWLLGDVTIWMGSGDACTNGASYTFYRDSRVDLLECVEGAQRTTSSNWSLKKDGVLDIVLTIDATTYTVLFYERDGKQYMLLRLTTGSKIDPVSDREFEISGD